MKALLSMIFAGISVFTISAQSVTKEVTDGIRYCESTYPYEGGMLITRVRDKDCVKNRVKRAKIVRFTLC